MRLTLAEAARSVGRSRTALLRSIKAGRLSAERDPLRGGWIIDASELARLYPLERDAPVTHVPDASGTGRDAPEIGELRARLADMTDQVQDLRRRLDASDAERRHALDRAAQERITALLTDQRPATTSARRRWWIWRR